MTQTIDKNQSTYKPTKLLRFFVILGIIQALVIGLGIVAIFWASQLKDDAAMAGGLVLGVLVLYAAMAAAVLALINVVGLPMYITMHTPRGKWLGYSIFSLTISVLLLVYIAYLYLSY